ncbi:MAG: L-serine ammonia-lyase, iron-sulfur-dependent, subunit alpha [Verrucomicrobiales bacterium]
MRGPSSSHSAAALRIGRMARDLMSGELTEVVVDYDPNGSLVTTHEPQGSDLGLFGGLMGWQTDDERLPDFREEIRKAEINVEVRYLDYGAVHPNTYRLTLCNADGEQHMTAISTGGGMIEVQEINGAKVRMAGDYFEILVFVSEGAEGLAGWLRSNFEFEEVLTAEAKSGVLIEVKSRCLPEAELLEELRANASVSSVRVLEPVLPVLARRNMSVPFITGAQMELYREEYGGEISLGTLGVLYESERGGIAEDEVRSRMTDLVGIMEQSIRVGLGGTEYADRILPCQSVNFEKKMDNGGLVPGDVLNRVILYVTAMMEIKSSMGVIVAAPTAGSCGALPGAILGVADAMEKSIEERVEAMLAAGMIGVFIAAHSTFAAEEAGCMAECGSGASMGAAGIVSLAGGSYHQQMGAASMALQNSLGLTCDTLANRVEAPCLGRNVTAASNALSSANMALADFKHLVPIDQVVDAMREVGELMPREICCTGLGGLAVTPASREIARELKEREQEAASAEGKVQVQEGLK